jgi:hypothetical protein
MPLAIVRALELGGLDGLVQMTGYPAIYHRHAGHVQNDRPGFALTDAGQQGAGDVAGAQGVNAADEVGRFFRWLVE